MKRSKNNLSEQGQKAKIMTAIFNKIFIPEIILKFEHKNIFIKVLYMMEKLRKSNIFE